VPERTEVISEIKLRESGNVRSVFFVLTECILYILNHRYLIILPVCCHTKWIGAESSYLKQGNGFVDFNDNQGRRRHLMMKLLLRPSDVWIEDRLESR
jgi:hypothetical protein